jgi:hypothetical protein
MDFLFYSIVFNKIKIGIQFVVLENSLKFKVGSQGYLLLFSWNFLSGFLGRIGRDLKRFMKHIFHHATKFTDFPNRRLKKEFEAQS